MELKLILSSNSKGWNFSENIIAEKNLSNQPWEFGYALAASRPLALKGSATRCTFCRQNFIVGAEMYGGLRDRHSFGLRETSHYLAPVAGWSLPSGWTLRVSPGFGLNDNSHKFLLRWGLSREIKGFDQLVRQRNHEAGDRGAFALRNVACDFAIVREQRFHAARIQQHAIPPGRRHLCRASKSAG